MPKLIKIYAIFLVIMLAMVLAGCGGDDTAAEDGAAATNGTATNGQVASGQADSTGTPAAATGDPMPDDLIGLPIVPTDQSPDDFVESMDSAKVIVVTFYMIGPSDDQRVRSAVQSLESQYSARVDFYTYRNTDGQSYKDLATLLNVNTTPTVIVINGTGVVQRAWTGYADVDSIEQGIVEALRE